MFLSLYLSRDAGTGGAGGAAAPVALYQEGQGGKRCPFNLKDCSYRASRIAQSPGGEPPHTPIIQ